MTRASSGRLRRASTPVGYRLPAPASAGQRDKREEQHYDYLAEGDSYFTMAPCVWLSEGTLGSLHIAAVVRTCGMHHVRRT